MAPITSPPIEQVVSSQKAAVKAASDEIEKGNNLPATASGCSGAGPCGQPAHPGKPAAPSGTRAVGRHHRAVSQQASPAAVMRHRPINQHESCRNRMMCRFRQPPAGRTQKATGGVRSPSSPIPGHPRPRDHCASGHGSKQVLQRCERTPDLALVRLGLGNLGQHLLRGLLRVFLVALRQASHRQVLQRYRHGLGDGGRSAACRSGSGPRPGSTRPAGRR